MEEEDIKLIIYKTRKDIIQSGIESIDSNKNKYSSVQLSLGIELLSGEMVFIIKRDSSIPVKNFYSYVTERDYQNEFLLKIYQGERIFARRNILLQKFPIKIPSKPKGQVKIHIIFTLNNSNLLKVNVKVIENYKSQKMSEYNVNISTLEEDRVEDLIEVAKVMKDDDKNDIETMKSKNEFENYVYKVKYKVEEVMEWIEGHQKEDTQKYIDTLNKLKEELLK